jgi:thiol:disulfide interchange protein DsbD
MATYGTIPLKADWTRRDDEIGAWLNKYGRAGVPFYLVIPADPNAPAISLGEVITPTSVINALKQASGA